MISPTIPDGGVAFTKKSWYNPNITTEEANKNRKVYMVTIFFKYLAKSLTDTVVLFYNELFKGDQRYMFLIGFIMVTFSIPFILIWLSIAFVGIYAYFCLKKVDPENWEKYYKNGFIFHKDYKKWLKGGCEGGNVFFKVYRKYERFGKICFYTWLFFVVIVAIAVVIVDKFNVQF